MGESELSRYKLYYEDLEEYSEIKKRIKSLKLKMAWKKRKGNK